MKKSKFKVQIAKFISYEPQVVFNGKDHFGNKHAQGIVNKINQTFDIPIFEF